MRTLSLITFVVVLILSVHNAFAASQPAINSVAAYIQKDAPKTAALLLKIAGSKVKSKRSESIHKNIDIIYNFYKVMRTNGDFYFMQNATDNFTISYFELFKNDNLDDTQRLKVLLKLKEQIDSNEIDKITSDNVIILYEMQQTLKRKNYSILPIDQKIARIESVYRNILDFAKKVDSYNDSFLNLSLKSINYFFISFNFSLISTWKDSDKLSTLYTSRAKELNSKYNSQLDISAQELYALPNQEISTGIKLDASLESILAYYLKNKTISIKDFSSVSSQIDTKIAKISTDMLFFVKDHKFTALKLPNKISILRVSVAGNDLVFYENKLLTFDYQTIPNVNNEEIVANLDKKYGKNKSETFYYYEDKDIYIDLYFDKHGGNYNVNGLFFVNVPLLERIFEVSNAKNKKTHDSEKKKLDNL